MPKHRLLISRKTEAIGSSQTWLRFVEDPGDGGVTSTFNGGEPLVVPRIIVDLSAAASMLLGQQVAQSASYRLRGMTIGFSPKDDAINNESDGAFNGRCLWYGDTAHGRKALSLARRMEREDEGDQLDGDSFLLGNDVDYQAVRFGMSDDNDVLYQTSSSNMLDAYGKEQWNLATVMSAYDAMTEPPQENALFSGRAPGRQSFGWQTSHTSGDQVGIGGIEAGNGGWMTPMWWQQQSMMHDVLAGLIEIQILGSTMAGSEGGIQDDWHTEVTIDFEVVV